MPELQQAVIALGSNLPSSFGSPADALDEAVRQIASLGTVMAVSSFHQTAPEMNLDQPAFTNGALLLYTQLDPPALLAALLAIEAAMGRIRKGVPAKGPRVIDLDVIFYADAVMTTPELTLPHPGLAERRFVLAPLAEIAPAWRHPVTGLTVAEMLGRLR